MGELPICTITKFSGDSFGSVCFSPKKFSPHQEVESHNKRHLNANCSFYKSIETNSGNNCLQSSIQNPNKAIVTIDSQTTEILTANKLAFYLLGINSEDCAVKLKDFLLLPEDQFSFSEADIKTNGDLVLFSGKVMDLITFNKQIVPVSVWARKLSTDNDQRCLVLMEPVERTTGIVKFDSTGKIFHCDSSFANLYGCFNPEDLIDVNLSELIPAVQFGIDCQDKDRRFKEGEKQCLTSRTIDGIVFPLSIQVNRCSSSENLSEDLRPEDSLQCKPILYEGVVWVFSNISGLITLSPDGTIHSCNTNFSLILFGYSQTELVGKNISTLIPTFYDDIEFLDTESMALPPFDDDDDFNAKCGTSDGRTTADSLGTDLSRPINPMLRSIELRPESSDQVYSPVDESQSLTNHPLQYSEQQSPSSQPNQDELSPLHDSDRLSPFSSLYNSSSKQLSYSESQDTIHSSTNSITESDINANFKEYNDVDHKSGEDDDQSSESSNCEQSYSNDNDTSNSNSDSSCSEKADMNPHSIQCNRLMPNTFASGTSQRRSPTTWRCPCDDKNCSEYKNLQETVALNNFLTVESSPTTSKGKGNKCLHSVSECDLSSHIKASTPREQSFHPLSDNSCQSIPEGDFVGIGRHRDGTDLAIEYCIKKVLLEDGKFLYCLWVSRDPDQIKECSPLSKAHTSNNYSESSKTESNDSSNRTESSNSSMLPDSVYTEGAFAKSYTILQHIGKGAFGCIKKAYRNSDGLIVIAKFICKSEVYKDLWVQDNKLKKKVPLEISLLSTIDHPNIVKVLDVFENEQCFQMVMEKHGSGMDLFEFIERQPYMGEDLASYIFRQIVSALSYLHDLSILHRDIKDENVIINEKFHVKLIDFGSAVFMGDEPFSTFCGTMEYCSPEVIRGNKYHGPELEMFALGVTLYTLMFGENPFVGADEILKGEYKIPSNISTELSDLIAHLLEPDPLKRCTLAEVEDHTWVNQPVALGEYNFGSVVNATSDEIHPSHYVSLSESDLENTTYSDSSVSGVGSRLSSIDLNSLPRTSTESEEHSFL